MVAHQTQTENQWKNVTHIVVGMVSNINTVTKENIMNIEQAKPLNELSLEKSNYSLRIKCKQTEIKEYLFELAQAIGPNGIAVLEQKIHDIAYLATKEAYLAGEIAYRQKLIDSAAKDEENAANEILAETTGIPAETIAETQE